MIFDEHELLLATGLNLRQLAGVIHGAKSREEMAERLGALGEKYHDRYQTFREYRQLVGQGKLKEPIIPVLGAMPCVGKTTMAEQVAFAYGIGNVIGGDSFRAALREFVSKDANPAFHTSVYESWKFFGEKTKENMVKGYESQAVPINQAMDRIVSDRGIRDGESMVVEYLHFLPSQFARETLEAPGVIPIVLRLDSETEYRRRIGIRERTTHLKGNSARLLDAMEAYLAMQERQCADARRHGIPVISTDDWAKAHDTVLTLINERIKRLNANAT